MTFPRLSPNVGQPSVVTAGYVVRTRADGDTVEARANDTSKRDAGLASGAQWVSTDYPVPGIAVGFTTPYVAEIPGGTVARCNPVNGPASCVSATLESVPVVPPTPTTSTTTEPGSTTVPGASSTTTPGSSTTSSPDTTTGYTPRPYPSYPVARPATSRRGPVAYAG
ncbi:MAG: Ca2+-dependent phosphoinositide-specific phospholipase C [Aquihabitans sp.]